MKDLNETTNTAPDTAEAGMSEEFRKCLKLERRGVQEMPEAGA